MGEAQLIAGASTELSSLQRRLLTEALRHWRRSLTPSDAGRPIRQGHPVVGMERQAIRTSEEPGPVSANESQKVEALIRVGGDGQLWPEICLQRVAEIVVGEAEAANLCQRQRGQNLLHNVE